MGGLRLDSQRVLRLIPSQICVWFFAYRLKSSTLPNTTLWEYGKS